MEVIKIPQTNYKNHTVHDGELDNEIALFDSYIKIRGKYTATVINDEIQSEQKYDYDEYFLKSHVGYIGHCFSKDKEIQTVIIASEMMIMEIECKLRKDAADLTRKILDWLLT